MPAKYVNENFFEGKGKTPNELKAMGYVKGLFIASYIPQPNNGILFRSSHKDLVEIVKEQLESEHDIISDPRGKSSHWVEFKNKPDLYHKLGEMGLNAPKSERTFPDVEEQYLDHFVRGFFDAQAIVCYNTSYNLTSVVVGFNPSFLLDLHKKLLEYAYIKRDEPQGESTRYGHKDSIRIHHFIYRDWEFIESNGLYLASKKALYVLNNSGNHNKTEAQQRIANSQELLLQGMNIGDAVAAEGVSYSHRSGFQRAFRRVTSKTPAQFVRENAQRALVE